MQKREVGGPSLIRDVVLSIKRNDTATFSSDRLTPNSYWPASGATLGVSYQRLRDYSLFHQRNLYHSEGIGIGPSVPPPLCHLVLVVT